MTTYRYYWLLVAASIAVLFAFQPDWSEWRRSDPDVVTAPATDARSVELAIQGLRLVSLERGRLAVGLDAELFWVRPRKFLFYTVAEENELYIEGARLQIHLSPDSGEASALVTSGPSVPVELPSSRSVAPASVAPMMTVSPLLSEFGLVQILRGFPEVDGVSQINIRGITVEVFRGMQRVLLLTADSAASDSASHSIRFHQVRLEKPATGRVLIATMAVWSGPRRQLRLPDGYQETGLWGTVQSGSASLGIDLVIRRDTAD